MHTVREKSSKYRSKIELTLVNHASEYINEKKRNKYLIFDDYVNKNKPILKKYADIWGGIKNKIKVVNGGEESNYAKYCMKIKLNSDDDLPLNKRLKISCNDNNYSI